MADCFGIAQVQDVLQLVEEVAQVLVVVEEEVVVVGEWLVVVVVVKLVLDLVVGNLDEKMKVVLHPCYQERYVVPMNMSNISVTVIHKS